MMRLRLIGIIVLSAICVACAGAEQEQPDPIDITLLDKTLSGFVEEGDIMGGAALVYKQGEEAYYGDFGQADREAAAAWQRDTLVTLYSMTKPVTGVTLMSLYEDGLFELEDPLGKYLPEYADMSVIKGLDAEGQPIIEPASRPIKVIDLFRHTACFGYGWEDHPAASLLNAAQVLDPSKPLAQFSEELAELPLYCHPGTQWKYGVSVDVQARLAEVVTGRPYEDIVRERVLDPLGMSDTTYFVPPEEKHRLAAVYSAYNGAPLSRDPDASVYGFRDERPVQINGGHGLISTIDDYMRFALMLQNEGSIDGVEILKPETVALMSRDHLPEGMTEKDFLPTKGQMGFGLDFAVRTAPPVDDDEAFGVVGEFFWDGAASPLFWVDPENDVTVVFLIQKLPFDMETQKAFRRAVYQSLGLLEPPV